MKPRLVGGIGLLSALLLSTQLAACGGTMNWTESTLELKVEGIEFQGDKFGRASWVGTGFWIDDELFVTNAHVATRGHRIMGVHDDKQKYHFDTIVGIDRNADIAVLRADRRGDKKGVKFIEKPKSAKDLRGRPLMMVGNSGGLGLGFYEGRVTNVLGEPPDEIILHDTRVVGGSSGSAIYDKEEGKVMGIHHSGHEGLDAKFASPSWRIQKLVAEARTKKGIPLDQLFTIPKLLQHTRVWGQREFCVAAGQKALVTFEIRPSTDIVGFIKPRDPNAVLMTGLVYGGQQVQWSANFKGDLVLPFSLRGGGRYDLVVVAPPGLQGQVCGIIGAGEVEWEKGIQ
jgi:hypothetical protein